MNSKLKRQTAQLEVNDDEVLRGRLIRHVRQWIRLQQGNGRQWVCMSARSPVEFGMFTAYSVVAKRNGKKYEGVMLAEHVIGTHSFWTF